MHRASKILRTKTNLPVFKKKKKKGISLHFTLQNEVKLSSKPKHSGTTITGL